ncbi:MAG: DUF1292 domain-containing protein [Oscillospiraceae bacterium]|nr:DUF1292 domain-containing protein [Oscillospiraceae bacterium]
MDDKIKDDCTEENEKDIDCDCGFKHEFSEECNCDQDFEVDDEDEEDENEDDEFEPLLVDLEDEDGNIVSCEVIDSFDYNENQYIIVLNPKDDSNYLFKAIGDSDEPDLIVPEDDEFDEVVKYYDSLVEDDDEADYADDFDDIDDIDDIDRD